MTSRLFPVNVKFTVYDYEYKHITVSTIYPKIKIVNWFIEIRLSSIEKLPECKLISKAK